MFLKADILTTPTLFFQLPFGAGVGDAKAVFFGVALRLAAGQGTHYGNLATVFDGVLQTCIEKSKLCALSAPFGNGACARE